MTKNNRFISFVKELDIYIAVACLVIIIFTTVAGVIMRYVVNSPLMWGEEVQMAAFVWLIFIGGTVGFKKAAHIAVDMFVDMFPLRLQRVVTIINYLVAMVIFVYLLVQGIAYVQLLASRTTSILGMPVNLIYSVLPISAALMIINYTLYTIAHIRKKDEEETEQWESSL